MTTDAWVQLLVIWNITLTAITLMLAAQLDKRK